LFPGLRRCHCLQKLHCWVALAPADIGVIEKLFKKDIREREERLMLAVLQDAIECFQANALSEQPWEKKLFQEAENWILEKNTDWFFSFENICETLQMRILLTIRVECRRFRRDRRRIRSFQSYPAMSIGEILTR
jgi:hypothetical protein